MVLFPWLPPLPLSECSHGLTVIKTITTITAMITTTTSIRISVIRMLEQHILRRRSVERFLNWMELDSRSSAFCWMSSSLSPRLNTLSTLSLRREVTSLTSPSRSSNLSRLLAPLLIVKKMGKYIGEPKCDTEMSKDRVTD